jgi:hypothetical protein
MDAAESGRNQVTFRIPMGGMYPSLFDFVDHPSGGMEFERLLEPNCTWRAPSEADRTLIQEWFESFKDFHAREDTQRGTYARTVLVGETPEEWSEPYVLDWGQRIASLVVAATLYTVQASIRYQSLHFTYEGGAERPRGGARLFETLRLGSWPAPYAEELKRPTVEAIVESYPFVRRALKQPPEHRLARALMAYRIATSSTRFADHIPVMLCACLEALTASTKEGEVLDLAQRYTQSMDSRETLQSLYKHRHWFAHGIEISEMSRPEKRMETLDAGLREVKEVLRNALLDDAYFELAGEHARAVRRYLGG